MSTGLRDDLAASVLTLHDNDPPDVDVLQGAGKAIDAKTAWLWLSGAYPHRSRPSAGLRFNTIDVRGRTQRIVQALASRFIYFNLRYALKLRIRTAALNFETVKRKSLLPRP
jgi:hypothetical protein